jgi:hypothetical protein
MAPPVGSVGLKLKVDAATTDATRSTRRRAAATEI